MKFILIILSVISITAAAQTKSMATLDTAAIKVYNWGLKSYMVTNEFWAKTKTEVISKIGKEKFESVRMYSAQENIPASLLMFDGEQKVPMEEYHKRLNSLRVYRLVDFGYDQDGSIFKYTIISVPYQHLYWAPTVKWDTVYFVIRSEGLQGT